MFISMVQLKLLVIRTIVPWDEIAVMAWVQYATGYFDKSLCVQDYGTSSSVKLTWTTGNILAKFLSCSLCNTDGSKKTLCNCRIRSHSQNQQFGFAAIQGKTDTVGVSSELTSFRLTLNIKFLSLVVMSSGR